MSRINLMTEVDHAIESALQSLSEPYSRTEPSGLRSGNGQRGGEPWVMKNARSRKSYFEVAFGGHDSAAQSLEFGLLGSSRSRFDESLLAALQSFHERFQLRKMPKHGGRIKQLHMRIAQFIESIELL